MQDTFQRKSQRQQSPGWLVINSSPHKRANILIEPGNRSMAGAANRLNANNQRIITSDNSHAARILINETVRIRRNNNKDSVVQALRAGRILTGVKDNMPHGEWLDYLESLAYSSVRESQLDMQLWNTWLPEIEKAVQEFGSDNNKTPEEIFVSTFSHDDITTSLSAMLTLARNNTPDSVRAMAVSLLKNGEKITSSDAKKLSASAKVRDSFKDEHQKEMAQKMIDSGVRNPSVLKRVPSIVASPEVAEEVQHGYITVPDVETGTVKTIPVADASETDIALALNNEETERNMKKIRDRADYAASNSNDATKDVFVKRVTGSVSKAIQQLSDLDSDAEYTFVVYKKVKQSN